MRESNLLFSVESFGATVVLARCPVNSVGDVARQVFRLVRVVVDFLAAMNTAIPPFVIVFCWFVVVPQFFFKELKILCHIVDNNNCRAKVFVGLYVAFKYQTPTRGWVWS